jgi:hypothetical protein
MHKSGDLRLFRASKVFREGAENCTRGGRAPHLNLGFAAQDASPSAGVSPAGCGVFLSGLQIFEQAMTNLRLMK